MNMESYKFLLDVALILLSTKVLGLITQKLQLPQVVGALLAGLLFGPAVLNIIQPTEFLSSLSEIGVIVIMFGAGMSTDIKELKQAGTSGFLVALVGVLVPLGLGTLLGLLFAPGESDPSLILQHVFIGTILTATSVSITVATLKELGKLDGPVGTSLVSAAIIDDVIGIVLLSIVISLSGGEEATAPWVIPTGDSAWSVVFLILIMAAFFAISIALGIGVHKLFDWMGKKYPHHRRIPMLSLGFCFLWAFVAEIFHIADITGAYVAGLILANTSASSYIDHRVETTANVLFTPVFFASVALKMFSSLGVGSSSAESISSISGVFIGFGLVWVVCGLLGKVLGAGFGAKITGSNFKDSTIIGVGMMARAEVLIVTAQEGVDSGLVEPAIIPFTLILILVSSFLTPILLRYLCKEKIEVVKGG